MALDVYTLFICELYVLGFLSIIMIFAWSGAHYDRVLGFTTIAIIATMASVWLGSLRSHGHLFLPVAVGNTLVMLAYGMWLNAFRVFAGLRPGPGWLFGALLWALLCCFPSFFYSMPKRIMVSCLLCISYTVALITLLTRSRACLQITFWPAQQLLCLHLIFHLSRMCFDSGSSGHGAMGNSPFASYVILESTLFVIGLTFTILAMVNERTQIRYKQASLRDPLTGVWNRRGLFAQVGMAEKKSLQKQLPLVALVFDLDHFKNINDRYGHNQGDRVLLDFCRVVEKVLPAECTFSRLGGEEFAAFFVGDVQKAQSLCEDIRLLAMISRPDNIEYTVSIGIAAGRTHSFSTLMMMADKALYEAKADGRNRIEMTSAPQAATLDKLKL
ncbi:GGDEF domain-containing protein [Mixta theicola]|uniref:diguanylate cyclase n=1 Tax=Mixta theicola TaxID=1458355 RepID=A0A2K1Q5K7_9GAMM|nr:GGDEF domain-containing protein [Mixta theicola]PNS10291.1 GGDEF domain-containing protein [Mixta theicola]GLR09563.1 GGDEF domain-containing protein [Mixta theicola]